METIKEESRINLTKIHKKIIPKIPPWTIKTPKVILTFCKFQKSKTHALIFQEELEKIKDKYPRHSHIFKKKKVLSRRKQPDAMQYTMEKRLKHLPNDKACVVRLSLLKTINSHISVRMLQLNG